MLDLFYFSIYSLVSAFSLWKKSLFKLYAFEFIKIDSIKYCIKTPRLYNHARPFSV